MFIHPHKYSKMGILKPLVWRAFLKRYVFSGRFYLIRVDGGPNRKKNLYFQAKTDMCGWGLMLICDTYIHGKITCRMNILHFYIISGGCIRIYHKSSIKPHSQLAFPPLIRRRKLIRPPPPPPLPAPNYSSVINDRLY